jgi:hypothetical protein
MRVMQVMKMTNVKEEEACGVRRAACAVACASTTYCLPRWVAAWSQPAA